MQLKIDGATKFEKAILVDGSTMEKVWPCRFNGYDTRLFITDGEDYVPMDAVVRLVGARYE